MSEKVYISGPMTGYVDFNRPAFRLAERRLRNMGFDQIVNPAALDEAEPSPLVDGTPEAHAWYMRRDIAHLLGCRAIYMLPGWRYSKGATLEHKVAEAIGLREIVDPNPAAWACLEGEPEDLSAQKPSGLLRIPDDTEDLSDHPRFGGLTVVSPTEAALSRVHNEGVRA